jgi:hypothetical protein
LINDESRTKADVEDIMFGFVMQHLSLSFGEGEVKRLAAE